MSKRVLIVDDTKTVPTIIQMYLMGFDLQFEAAADGAQGLRQARASRPDLIISDVQMPVMDGFELCAAVRADAALAATPLVLLTALKDEPSRAKGRLLGASAFLNKPVRPDELREVVSRLLGLPPPKS